MLSLLTFSKESIYSHFLLLFGNGLNGSISVSAPDFGAELIAHFLSCGSELIEVRFTDNHARFNAGLAVILHGCLHVGVCKLPCLSSGVSDEFLIFRAEAGEEIVVDHNKCGFDDMVGDYQILIDVLESVGHDGFNRVLLAVNNAGLHG